MKYFEREQCLQLTQLFSIETSRTTTEQAPKETFLRWFRHIVADKQISHHFGQFSAKNDKLRNFRIIQSIFGRPYY